MGALASTPSKADKLSKYTPVGFVDKSTDVAYHLFGNQVELAKLDVNALCCLAEVSPLLYVTSAIGASLAAKSAAHNKAQLVVVSVCDAKTCLKIRRELDRHDSIELHSLVVPVDDYRISPFDFVMTFYAHARELAVILESQAERSVVVHCVMGMNRSCATIVFAQILSGKVQNVKALISYVKNINKRVRLEVLENQAFVNHLVAFGDFAMSGPGQDTTLKQLAQRFERFCQTRVHALPYY